MRCGLWLVLCTLVLQTSVGLAQVPSIPNLNLDVDLGIVGTLFRLPFFSIDLSCVNTTLILDAVDCFIAPFGLDLETLRDLPDSPLHLSPYATDPRASRTLKAHQFKPKPQWKQLFEDLDRLQKNIVKIQRGQSDASSKLRKQINSIQAVFIEEMKVHANTKEKLNIVANFEKELRAGVGRVDLEYVVTEFLNKVIAKVQELPLMMNKAVEMGLATMSEDQVNDVMDQVENLDDVELINDVYKAILCTTPTPRAQALCNLINTIERGIECMQGFPRAEFEDGLVWMGCLYRCKDIRVMSTCMVTAFEPCGGLSWLGPLLVKAVTQYFRLNHCGAFSFVSQASSETQTQLDEINMDVFGRTEPIELEGNETLYSFLIDEGDDAENVLILNNYHPVSHCIDFRSMQTAWGGLVLLARGLGNLLFGYQCEVQMQMWLTNYIDALTSQYIPGPGLAIMNHGEPLCRSKFLISQAKLGKHDYGKENNQCDIIITEENWLTEWEIPLKATIDNKEDGDQTAYFTLKQVIDGFHGDTVIAKVYIRDNDVRSTRNDQLQHHTCQSTNDPHIITFDGHYYNNFYHGYFILYRHLTLPYEVQVLYQACSDNLEVSCSCAVAIRSGDDVMVIDRCAKQPDYCDDTTGFCGDEDQMTIRYYVNDELTPGTHMYQRYDGHRWEVLLPHGQLVRVKTDDHPNMLNIMIRSSTYDVTQGSEGLCGRMDGEVGDDLVMRDGSIYNGEGSEFGEQPREFIQEWRALDDELIFQGAAASPHNSTEFTQFCRCHHIIALGTHCVCDSNIVETCDLQLERDVTHEIDNLREASLQQPAGIEGALYDPEYVPPELPPWDISTNWTEVEAGEQCREQLEAGTAGCREQLCGALSCDPFEQQVHGCKDDIRLTNSLEWMGSAIEATKESCMDRVIRELYIAEATFDSLYNSLCAHGCYSNGECLNATCTCNDDYYGAACNIPTSAVPETRPAGREPGDLTIYCDTRQNACITSSVFGVNFTDNTELQCMINEIQVHADDVPMRLDPQDLSPTWMVTPNQLACHFPRVSSWQYYLVWTREDVVAIQELVYFISYDSACYQCADNKCSLRDPVDGELDYCMIEGACYASGEHERPVNGSVVEACHVCNPSYSTSKFDYIRTEECDAKYNELINEENKKAQDDRVKMIVSINLCAMILVVTVILYACYGRLDTGASGEEDKVAMQEMAR